MKETKEVKKSGSNLGVVLFCMYVITLLIIALGVMFFLFAKVDKNDTIASSDKDGVTIEKEEIEDDEEEIEVEENSNKEYVEGLKSGLAKLKGTDKDPQGQPADPSVIIGTTEIYSKQGIQGFSIECNGDLYAMLDATSSEIGKKYGAEYKIKSDVVKAGVSELGQSGECALWTIDAEGNAEYMTLGNSFDNISFKKIDAKNVIDVISLSTTSGVLLAVVDIEGNIVEVK